MESDQNDENAGDEPVTAQTAPAEMSSGEVQAAAQQLQASVSRFGQEDRRTHEDLSRLMDQPGDQMRSFEKKIEDVHRATERNLEIIRYNRSWHE